MRDRQIRSDAGETIEALATDLYLEALLAQVERRAARTADGVRPAAAIEAGGVSGLTDANVDPALRHAAGVLRASLLRAHPSFRFEERLAAQLAGFAASATSAAAGSSAARPRPGAVRRPLRIIPFPGAGANPDLVDPLLSAVLSGELDPADEDAVRRAAGLRSPARPLLVGGAITSAALSLVGVAWVAWRASRPGGASMSRAVRAAHARRLAGIVELADLAGVTPAGVPGGPA